MESISDDYDHLQSDLEYVVENVLQTTNTRTDSFERLADEFNSFIENKCSCSTLSKCKDDNCCHGNSYIRNDELVLNSNRRSKDLIYECSAHCSCTQKCENRLVQFGLRKHLRIVPCDRKRLGLITLAAIAEGAFICEYAGEVLTKNEAVRRQRRNDESGEMNYIICLIERPTAADENAKICTFIDPSRLGNIGRYLNHSCDPNCEILSVRIDGPIPKLGNT